MPGARDNKLHRDKPPAGVPSGFDRHRWLIQIIGLLVVGALAAWDIAPGNAPVDRTVFLILGGIAVGVRPETIPEIVSAVFATRGGSK